MTILRTDNMRPFSLWSFLRNVLQQGEAIGLDHRERPYEEYSARMDAAAREREEQLRSALDYETKGWRPIETAPRDGRWIHVWLRGNREESFNEKPATVRYDSTTSNVAGGLFWSYPGVGGLKASHWTPVPSSPAETVSDDSTPVDAGGWDANGSPVPPALNGGW